MERHNTRFQIVKLEDRIAPTSASFAGSGSLSSGVSIDNVSANASVNASGSGSAGAQSTLSFSAGVSL